MSCLTKLAYFLLSYPILLRAYRRYAKNLNIFSTNMRFRPISSDSEHTLFIGLPVEILFRLESNPIEGLSLFLNSSTIISF